MTYKETANQIIWIMDTANKYRSIARNPEKKRDTPSSELEKWYKSVINIVEKLLSSEHDKLEYQAFLKFRDIIKPEEYLHLHIDRIRKYLNMMINNLDSFYPVLYRRYFNINYNKNSYRYILKHIIQ